MSEELSEYMREIGIKVHYLHSEIDTIERIEILRDLRLGTYDVVVGINLLREGLDLPEVSLVAILDADKEGYLRSSTSLIQTIGRAARHDEGKVIMYADKITKSMDFAISETNRRRELQKDHNNKNNIIAQKITKVRILIVDDSPVNRDLFSKQVSHFGSRSKSELQSLALPFSLSHPCPEGVNPQRRSLLQ